MEAAEVGQGDGLTRGSGLNGPAFRHILIQWNLTR
jgi:hypothetical protein